MKPLCIDLYAGLGGWAEGFLAEGYDVIGFDIEDMCAKFNRPRPGGVQLVIQDVLTLHGRQFKDAACIVASPPCQEFSYMAMPWSRGKQIEQALLGEGEFPTNYTGSRTVEQLTALFDACFRIQREASEAAGRHIPMIVENVRGAQKWVGRSRGHYGSYHLWGDVRALMPITCSGLHREGTITVGHVNKRDGYDHTRHLTNQLESDGVKFSQSGAAWFDGKPRDAMLGEKGLAAFGSKSNARKAADGFWQSIQALEADAAQGKQQVKVLRAQIKEAQRNFDGLMDEIVRGEVEVDDQQRLPL